MFQASHIRLLRRMTVSNSKCAQKMHVIGQRLFDQYPQVACSHDLGVAGLCKPGFVSHSQSVGCGLLLGDIVRTMERPPEPPARLFQWPAIGPWGINRRHLQKVWGTLADHHQPHAQDLPNLVHFLVMVLLNSLPRHRCSNHSVECKQ